MFHHSPSQRTKQHVRVASSLHIWPPNFHCPTQTTPAWLVGWHSALSTHAGRRRDEVVRSVIESEKPGGPTSTTTRGGSTYVHTYQMAEMRLGSWNRARSDWLTKAIITQASVHILDHRIAFRSRAPTAIRFGRCNSCLRKYNSGWKFAKIIIIVGNSSRSVYIAVYFWSRTIIAQAHKTYTWVSVNLLILIQRRESSRVVSERSPGASSESNIVP